MNQYTGWRGRGRGAGRWAGRLAGGRADRQTKVDRWIDIINMGRHTDGQRHKDGCQFVQAVGVGWLLSYISYWYIFCHIAEYLMYVVTFILSIVVILCSNSHVFHLTFSEQNNSLSQHNLYFFHYHFYRFDKYCWKLKRIFHYLSHNSDEDNQPVVLANSSLFHLVQHVQFLGHFVIFLL